MRIILASLAHLYRTEIEAVEEQRESQHSQREHGDGSERLIAGGEPPDPQRSGGPAAEQAQRPLPKSVSAVEDAPEAEEEEA